MTANSDGTLLSEVRYSAFGEIRYDSGTLTTDYLYTGQRQEAEVGLYYYVARWYDPAIGRFVQADSVVPDPGSALGYDRYAYALNSPLMYVDPSGHYMEQACGYAGGSCGSPSQAAPSLPSSTTPSSSTSSGNGGGDQPGNNGVDDLTKDLSDYYQNHLIPMLGKYDSATDLWLMNQLILKAFRLTNNPILAMKMVTALTRPKGVDVPVFSPAYEFPESEYFDNYGFTDSGFGDLADAESPNQISHFSGIAYITLSNLESLGDAGIPLSYIEVALYDRGSSKAARVDVQLGNIAVQFALDINNGMGVMDAVRRTTTAIQSFDYENTYPAPNNPFQVPPSTGP